LLALGFLTTVLIGFGTRVVLGHSGNVPTADGITKAIFYLTQIVVISRMLVSLDVAFGWEAGFLFDISFLLWCVLFIWWGGRFFKLLVFGKSKG